MILLLCGLEVSIRNPCKSMSWPNRQTTEEPLQRPSHYTRIGTAGGGGGPWVPGESHDGGAWWAAVHGVAKSQTRLHFHFHFSLSCIGEGNGNPLQCSCLEDPGNRGPWRAAIYGVARNVCLVRKVIPKHRAFYFFSNPETSMTKTELGT